MLLHGENLLPPGSKITIIYTHIGYSPESRLKVRDCRMHSKNHKVCWCLPFMRRYQKILWGCSKQRTELLGPSVTKLIQFRGGSIKIDKACFDKSCLYFLSIYLRWFKILNLNHQFGIDEAALWPPDLHDFSPGNMDTHSQSEVPVQRCGRKTSGEESGVTG